MADSQKVKDLREAFGKMSAKAQTKFVTLEIGKIMLRVSQSETLMETVKGMIDSNAAIKDVTTL
jgi:hypothetical protein